ncbi:hypothetical protein [Staphylococcus succinus]|uniref:hypothetical protein n=1 Tax=Staphylococcus succinus TaxID=61015 RepID=UPI000E684130|nr:hypothetical protein [Staphylococcus succinus]RIN43261.1 hypothetical protein BU059_06190 [Staphylococcus succinus]
MKKSTFSEHIAFISIFGLGLFTLVRGVFWFKEQESVLHDSDFYLALHQIMPIWVWGIVVAVFALILTCSSWFLPKQQINNVCNYLLLIGGLGTAIMYFVMLSASIFNAINWLTWVQFSILTVVCGLLGFVGGANIYDRRK